MHPPTPGRYRRVSAMQPIPASRDVLNLVQATRGGAGGARTHDRRIIRSAGRRSRRSTCTDATEPCHRWPSLHCMHGWLGPRTGPRPPQRARDVNYGASPHTARDPPNAWPWASSPPAVDVCRSGRSGAARGTVPGSGCRGSDVVVLVPQLVSQTARRGDRLDGEAVFEAA